MAKIVSYTIPATTRSKGNGSQQNKSGRLSGYNPRHLAPTKNNRRSNKTLTWSFKNICWYKTWQRARWQRCSEAPEAPERAQEAIVFIYVNQERIGPLGHHKTTQQRIPEIKAIAIAEKGPNKARRVQLILTYTSHIPHNGPQDQIGGARHETSQHHLAPKPQRP